MGDYKNILDAARYLNHNQETMFAKSHNFPKETTCPRQHQLIKQHYCWKHFFPSLPIITKDHAEHSNLNSLPLPNLTMEVAIMEASPHKAPGNNGLLAIV